MDRVQEIIVGCCDHENKLSDSIKDRGKNVNTCVYVRIFSIILARSSQKEVKVLKRHTVDEMKNVVMKHPWLYTTYTPIFPYELWLG